MKEVVYIQFAKLPLPDMSSEVLGALSATMLAQAQESLYYKTTLGEILVFCVNGVCRVCVSLMFDCVNDFSSYEESDMCKGCCTSWRSLF